MRALVIQRDIRTALEINRQDELRDVWDRLPYIRSKDSLRNTLVGDRCIVRVGGTFPIYFEAQVLFASEHNQIAIETGGVKIGRSYHSVKLWPRGFGS